jgi:hypothetical protein
MTERVFLKHYDDTGRCSLARRHLAWLRSLDSGVRLPGLREATTDTLALEYLHGTHPRPAHLVDVADALGRLHAAAYRRHLHAARLDRPYRTADVVITDFVRRRQQVLGQVPVDVAGRPAALYKDANVRNFVLTSEGVAAVDFDTLTLAPFGYDLAKLVVSAVMTYGRVSDRTVAAALDVYNARVGRVHELARCARWQFEAYAQIHDLLTRPYLLCNGYRYTWPDGRPVPHSGGRLGDVPHAGPTQHAPAATARAGIPEVQP